MPKKVLNKSLEDLKSLIRDKERPRDCRWRNEIDLFLYHAYRHETRVETRTFLRTLVMRWGYTGKTADAVGQVCQSDAPLDAWTLSVDMEVIRKGRGNRAIRRWKKLQDRNNPHGGNAHMLRALWALEGREKTAKKLKKYETDR